MLILLGALAGSAVASNPALGTLAFSVQMVAGILTAIPFSRYMARAGRRSGFLLACLIIIIGGAMAAVSMVLHNFWLLCIAHFLLGAALVGVSFMRFAASESVTETYKANAIAYTLASGLIAAFLGPTAFELTRDLLPSVYAGAYLCIALFGALGAIPLFALRLPQTVLPDQPAIESASQPNSGGISGGISSGISDSTIAILKNNPGISFAVLSAVVAQAIMVFLMVPTALAMLAEGFLEAQAADVIRWHVIAMFAPGLFTGTLIERFGSIHIIMTGLTLLLCSAAVALASISLPTFYTSLILLGLGWNFAFIGGTQLLQSELSLAQKGQIQGINDTLIALAGALASLLAGILFQAYGWTLTVVLAMPILTIAMCVLWVLARQYRAIKV